MSQGCQDEWRKGATCGVVQVSEKINRRMPGIDCLRIVEWAESQAAREEEASMEVSTGGHRQSPHVAISNDT